MMHILVVCSANVCRSPTGEAVIRKLLTDEGLDGDIMVDSAGTHGSTGTPPDVRSRLLAEGKGYELGSIRSRPLEMRDYGMFDLILAMDHKHYLDMRQECPMEHRDKIKMFLDFTPGMVGKSVPDPYYGEAKDFVIAFDLIEKGAKGLIEAIHDQKPHLAYRGRQ